MTGCRFCATSLGRPFIDLGTSPLCESYVTQESYNGAEPFYPLRLYVCERCFLVQLEALVTAEQIFSEYAYFSSYSDTWVQHARQYVHQAIDEFDLGPVSLVVEVASNDGYLLQHFVAKGIPVLGIEPARNVARAAIDKGVPTIVTFFGEAAARRLASSGQDADLIVANNVLAQVPDLNDFVSGLTLLLKPGGVITAEFPHVVRLIEGNQFDTIYHEHFSYFSLYSVERVFASRGLALFRVDTLPTHGGSLRVYAAHANQRRPEDGSVAALRAFESDYGIDRLATYAGFEDKVRETKRRLLEFLIEERRQGKRIVGYGAPGKGNTLLNYCGIRTDFVEFTVDRNPFKQGKFLPGTRIPIFAPDKIREARPDYVLILPWNLKDEIMGQLGYIREWGGRFVVPIPEVAVHE
jgi:SAM-dependent methyltransferase